MTRDLEQGLYSGHERDALIVAILTRCKTLHPVPLSPLVAFYIFLFLSKEMGRAMDNFTKVLGVVMLVLTLYVAVVTKPPLGEALLRAVAPTHVPFLPILTLLGGR